MKYLVWAGGIVAALVATLYVVAFTPLGNGIVKPIVEAKIKEQTKLDSKLETFLLGISDFEIVLALNEKNVIKAKGRYSLFSKSFDVAYNVSLKSLESLEPLTSAPLKGAFHTDGGIKGDLAFIEIEGKSDVGESDTSYRVELSDLNPILIIAKMKNAKLASLLYLGAQNPYATADIDLDINFRNINPHVMDGEIVLKSKNGTINPKFMKSDFNVTIPATSFSMNLDAKLEGDYAIYNYDFVSNLFKISTTGEVSPEPFKADLKYSLDIKELEVLKPITGADVRGALRLSGEAKGDKDNLLVSGKSDIASSDTTFEALLKNFAPSSIRAKIVNLDIAKVLFMIKQPHYADGLFSMNADISDARSGSLSGKITTAITKGELNSAYLTKTYEFKSPMSSTSFNSATTTVLKGDMAESAIKFNSNLANLDVKSAKYSIGNASFKSDYKASIPDLNKLFFVTDHHMRGAIVANGEISKAKDLDFTMHSNIADGKIDVKLHNDDFHADLSSIKSMKLLNILIYPELLDATINAKIDYNLSLSKGAIEAQVANALFAKNQTFDLIKQYLKFDMYRENFNGGISADIDKENILASVDLRSKEASIVTKSTKLNTLTNQLDTDITLSAKKNVVSGTLKGDVNSPKITIDLEKFMKSEAGRKIEEKVDKELNRLFKKLF
ncbi:hypothetical protein [Sulfurimonas sp.]|uniref:hypothetical protein n=1 Tax=Sulfurimonas sp. TaxID=2022749 RepID=UPI0025D5EF92|nr:hypothetical protein [Sulfurimonas sp.]MBW6489437.1 hypothetical protein [Sulfurimonas sp.]